MLFVGSWKSDGIALKPRMVSCDGTKYKKMYKFIIITNFDGDGLDSTFKVAYSVTGFNILLGALS